MEVSIIFKIAAVGILVSVLSQVLKHSGREEQAFLVSLAGLLVVLDEGYITNVAVRPEYRRQGIASELLEVFRRFGEGNHMAFLTLEVRAGNAPAIALYEKLGFREVGRRKNYYRAEHEDALLMTVEFDRHG